MENIPFEPSRNLGNMDSCGASGTCIRRGISWEGFVQLGSLITVLCYVKSHALFHADVATFYFAVTHWRSTVVALSIAHVVGIVGIVGGVLILNGSSSYGATITLCDANWACATPTAHAQRGWECATPAGITNDTQADTTYTWST